MKYIRIVTPLGERLTVMFEGERYTHSQMATLLGGKVISAGFVVIDQPRVRVSGFVPSLEVCAVPADANAIALAFVRAAALYPPQPERTAAATYPWEEKLTPEEEAAIAGTPAPAGPFPVSLTCSCQGCGMQFSTLVHRTLCASCQTIRHESR